MSLLNKNIYLNKKVLFYFGFLLSFAVTLAEVARGTHLNYLVFAESTRDFWRGISPYTEDFCVRNLREFLYTPVFSVLFTPFALLPHSIGAFVWNLFNYTMFYFAIFTLPSEKFAEKTKCLIFLYALPILAQSLLSCQYNVTVAYIFIFAYTLFEKNKAFWAIFLIMISGLTKIYGIFEMALIFCYPKFWRNLGFAFLIAILLILSPIVNLSVDEILPYYQEWFNTLMIHQTSRTWESIYYVVPFSEYLLPNIRAIQLGTLGILILLFFISYKKWTSSSFRAQCVGILTCWMILTGDSSEIHTYLIAISGYLLWYWTRRKHSYLDKFLFWAVFFLFCIVPIDILCPAPVMVLLHKTLYLHIWVMTFTWLIMIYKTLCSKPENEDKPTMNQPAAEEDAIDLVCPSYNPKEGFIEKVRADVEKIRGHYPLRRIHLIISDDGSSKGFDKSVQDKLLAEIDDVEIVGNEHRGKGSAVRSGISRSTAKYTIYTDIDMPYSFKSIVSVIDNLLSGYDVVIATRSKEYYSNLTLRRKIMSWGSKIMNLVILNIDHNDAQGGLKGLSAKARKAMMRTDIDGFLFDTQFVKNATNDNLSIVDIETELNPGIVMSNMSIKVLFVELKNFIKIAFTTR